MAFGVARLDLQRTPYSRQALFDNAKVAFKKAKDVPLDKALSYVAGYTVANELSARDLEKAMNPFSPAWHGPASL